MKKGFTLVELLVVIVIISIISGIAYIGISAVTNNSKARMWQGKIDAIESGAELYGEDNKNKLGETCDIDGTTYSACEIVTVGYLIEQNYVPTDERDESGNKVITNDTLSANDPNYYANDLEVYIYELDNIIYAKLNYS